MKVLKVFGVKRFKCGYEVRDELVSSPCSSDEPLRWKMAYTPRGDYIGDPKTAHRLVFVRGIQPEKRTPDSGVCSVGYSVKDGKWYGWSHRAIFGFQIGSKCREGDCHYTPTKQKVGGKVGRGCWTAQTTLDAREMACDFAEGVS